MTDNNIISMPDTDSIEEQASIWVMRLAEGEITASDPDFARWLSESQKHKDAFSKLSAFWDGLEFTEALNDYAESDVAKASMRQERMARRFRPLKPLLFGAVAASFIAFVSMLGFQSEDLATGSYQEQFETAVGEQETINLPDGSKVILNTNSALQVAFVDNKRRLLLTRGEAYFDVAPDATKPFSVQTDKGSVTAVGTAFSVRLVEKKLNVVVTEGRVALNALPEEPASRTGQGEGLDTSSEAVIQPLNVMEVSAGQTAVIDQGIEDISIIQPAVLAKTLDWQDGELSFRGETLDQVVRELQRYTNIRIEIADDQLREQKIVAYYKVGDVERMFEALNIMANIDVEHIGENHVRLFQSK